MSFFAVLDAAEPDKRTSFRVKKLHLNLWCLAAIGFHRRTFVLDVGVEIEATTKPVGAITVAIPFESFAIEALTDKVLNSKTAALLFDTTIESTTDHSITYEGQALEIANIATKQAVRDKGYSQSGFTLWTLPLTDEIPVGSSAYVRVRFPVTRTGRTWQWTRSHFQRTAATLDFRISDLRSSANIDGGVELIKRVRPIEVVAAFVMAPAWLHGRTIHPEPRYIRLLEARVWASYLNRAPEMRRRSRLVVYYWKNQTKKSADPIGTDVPITAPSPDASEALDSASTTTSAAANVAAIPPTSTGAVVTPKNPMRIYSDFTIDGRPSRALTAAMSAVFTVAAAAIFLDVSFRGWVTDTAGAVGAWIASYLGAITWAAVVAGFLYVLKWIGPVGKLYRAIVRGFLYLEATIFRTLPWLGPRE